MGRNRCGPEFDAGDAAVRAFEVLTGDVLPDESWRQRYFVLDARFALEGLRDRVESLEQEVFDLESERDMVREDRDEPRERVKDVEEIARTAARLLAKDGKGVVNEVAGLMEKIAEGE